MIQKYFKQKHRYLYPKFQFKCEINLKTIGNDWNEVAGDASRSEIPLNGRPARQ